MELSKVHFVHFLTCKKFASLVLINHLVLALSRFVWFEKKETKKVENVKNLIKYI